MSQIVSHFMSEILSQKVAENMSETERIISSMLSS